MLGQLSAQSQKRKGSKMTKNIFVTMNNVRINTDYIEEFHLEQYMGEPDTYKVRAYGHGKNGGYFDRMVSYRMNKKDAITYARMIKDSVPIKELVRNPVPYGQKWIWEEVKE